MNKPKIELKNVQTFQGHEGYGLNADIWINGLKCMHVHDSANGGCYDYHPFTYQNPKAEQVKANIKLLDAYVDSLPPKEYVIEDIQDTYKQDLDTVINTIMEERESARFKKEMLKKEVNHILYGIPNSDSYFKIKMKTPIAKYISIPIHRDHLILYLRDVKKNKFKEGYAFLNQNLKELLQSVMTESV
jgi:hypothetical protein